MKQLIINADDFGLHEAVNRGIIAGYTQGCITSTSLIPGGQAFEQAVSLAKQNPGLGVGVHLTLVADRPVTDPGQIPSLVDSEGRFIEKYPQFILCYLLGKVCDAEIRLELFAQVRKAAAAGIPITHLDSHQHLHVLPGILRIVIDLAKEFNIRAIRIPDESYFFLGGYPFTAFRLIGRSGLTFLARMARKKIIRQGIAAPDHFYGMLAGGNMREEYLQNIIAQLPNETSEIMMHPGYDNNILRQAYSWNYRWQEELAAVKSLQTKQRLEEKRVNLISFKELAHG
ncbi:MAG: ChbG/HpnK family deacetylase [Veillonellales bacterium]